jgi:hypothetical protein
LGSRGIPLTKPHLILENVTVTDGGNGQHLQNVLEITKFEKTGTTTRLEFVLKQSLRLKIPSLGDRTITLVV